MGMAQCAVTRQVGHKNQSSWYWDIARIEIEHFDTQDEAAAAEAAAVLNEKPKHNIGKFNGNERRGRPVTMTPERIQMALQMLNEGERGPPIWQAVRELPGPPISRPAYFLWQKKQDDMKRAKRKEAIESGDIDKAFEELT